MGASLGLWFVVLVSAALVVFESRGALSSSREVERPSFDARMGCGEASGARAFPPVSLSARTEASPALLHLTLWILRPPASQPSLSCAPTAAVLGGSPWSRLVGRAVGEGVSVMMVRCVAALVRADEVARGAQRASVTMYCRGRGGAPS